MQFLSGIFLAVISASFLVPSAPGGEIAIEAGEHNLESLVERASEFLKINYVISQETKQNLSQRIQCTAKQSFGQKEFRRFFEKTLIERSFCLDPIQGVDGDQFRVLDLWRQPGAKAAIVQSAQMVEPEKIEALDGRAIIVTTKFDLKFQDAQRIQANLRQYLSDPQLERVFNVGSRSILVTSYPSTILNIGKVLKSIDVAATKEQKDQETLEDLVSRLAKLERRIADLEKAGK